MQRLHITSNQINTWQANLCNFKWFVLWRRYWACAVSRLSAGISHIFMSTLDFPPSSLRWKSTVSCLYMAVWTAARELQTLWSQQRKTEKTTQKEEKLANGIQNLVWACLVLLFLAFSPCTWRWVGFKFVASFTLASSDRKWSMLHSAGYFPVVTLHIRQHYYRLIHKIVQVCVLLDVEENNAKTFLSNLICVNNWWRQASSVVESI